MSFVLVSRQLRPWNGCDQRELAIRQRGWREVLSELRLCFANVTARSLISGPERPAIHFDHLFAAARYRDDALLLLPGQLQLTIVDVSHARTPAITARRRCNPGTASPGPHDR